jgi:type IX secretion system PorP/SprF family membrane protein
MKRTITFIFLFSLKFCFSQDPVFTQFFMIPETVNSGFTGAYDSTKAGIIHRVQWPGLDFSVNTQFAHIDNWFEEINSGLGISLLNHKETQTRYNFTQVNLNYAYEVNITDTWYFRPSISIGVGTKNFGFQNILLEDQINIFSGLISTTSIDPAILEDNIRFFDYSASILFMKERSWIGASIRHLNKPNISLLYNENTALDMFMSIHGLLELPILRDYNSHFFLTANAMKQGEYNRLDFGSQYVYNERFSLALLAATNPIRVNPDSHFLTSINAVFGMTHEGWKFGYSYSFNTTNIGRTGGVYELSISYDFENNSNCFACIKY